jgi:DNA gyrase subunit A
MFNDLGLRPDGRYRKCAAVVGDVMGKYHPHGDQSIYDALVRMAQPFSLLAPLVDGQGNFGSLDGDGAAAMRYTECRLQPIALELCSEIDRRTVDFRPNYDGQRFEPIVLPAQFPQLLVNGSEGIAVGLATRIPPHPLSEVIDAAVALIDDPAADNVALLAHLQGPDFPTGGRILNEAREIRQFYEEGQGTFRVRGDWHEEHEGKRTLLVITSVPWGQNQAKVVERIGEEIAAKRLPHVVDLRDESTEATRIVLEVKPGAPVEPIMAYLFRKTPLQATFPMNLTALVPVPGSDLTRPARLDLRGLLRAWLDFRFDTVRRRFEFDLGQLRDRIHILEGFAHVFDALDEILVIIRTSQGRRDAHEKLVDRFDLSDAQVDAILELRLYRLAQLEIRLVREELDEKRATRDRIESILASDRELWSAVRAELLEIRRMYAGPRRTGFGTDQTELAFDAVDLLPDEDTFVVVTRDGWFKRQSSFSELGKIRLREGDEVQWLVQTKTRATLTLFGTSGRAYTVRAADVPATTGYGDPISAHYTLEGGERIVQVIPNDPRYWPGNPEPPQAVHPDPALLVAVTERGRVARFLLLDHREVSTRKGRLYARLDEGDAVFQLFRIQAGDRLALATRLGRALLFQADEVPILRAPGKGVTGIKLRSEDRVMAAAPVRHPLDGPTVITARGKEVVIREKNFAILPRGGPGEVVLKVGTIDTWVHGGPELWLQPPESAAPSPEAPADVEEA